MIVRGIRRRTDLEDETGQESFTVETAGGQKLTLTDGPGSVEIADSNSDSVTLETRGITVNAAAKVTLNASAVEINSGAVSVNAGMSRGHFILTGISALMFLAAFMFILRTKWGRAAFDRFKLRMPVLGQVFRGMAVSRFARTLGTLL